MNRGDRQYNWAPCYNLMAMRFYFNKNQLLLVFDNSIYKGIKPITITNIMHAAVRQQIVITNIISLHMILIFFFQKKFIFLLIFYKPFKYL